MKPDFEFGARRKNYLDSAEVKFQKFSYSARNRLKFKLVSTVAELQNRHQDFIYFPISNKERNSTFTIGFERFPPYSPHCQNTKMTILAPKALELGFSCFALLRVSWVVWRFGIDLLGPKGFPLCFRKSLTGRRCREQASG